MAYCGFSDSSSDDDRDESQDDDLNPAIKSDDWISSQPEATHALQSSASKRKETIKSKYSFNSHLAEQSLQDIKHQINRTKHKHSHSNLISAHAPPPLHTKSKRNRKRKRKDLDIREPVPASTHPWQNPPIITGVSAQTSMGKKMLVKDGPSKEPVFVPVKIKLYNIIHNLKNVEYKPEEFVAIRMKLKNPRMDVTIFSNGKMTTQGGKSKYSCVIAMRKVARMLQQLYRDEIEEISKVSFYGVQCNAHLGHRVDLQRMSEGFPKRVEYSPDIESAYLKFRDPLKYGDKGSCHVYHGGRVTILGCHSVENTKQWIEDMYGHCQPYFMDVEEMEVDGERGAGFRNMFESKEDGNELKNENDCDLFNGIAPPPLLD